MTAAQDCVEGRLSRYQKWYDKKAVKTKVMHFRMRTISVVGGALVPVLVNLDLSSAARLTATVLSLIVVGSGSLESVYRYREQWKN